MTDGSAFWRLLGGTRDQTPLQSNFGCHVELMDLVDAPFPDANRIPETMARLAATRTHRVSSIA